MLRCSRTIPTCSWWLLCVALAVLTARVRAVSECFRPQSPSEVAEAVKPLGERNSSLRVCLHDADDKCALGTLPRSNVSYYLYMYAHFEACCGE